MAALVALGVVSIWVTRGRLLPVEELADFTDPMREIGSLTIHNVNSLEKGRKKKEVSEKYGSILLTGSSDKSQQLLKDPKPEESACCSATTLSSGIKVELLGVDRCQTGRRPIDQSNPRDS